MFLRTELIEDVQGLQNETHRHLWLVASLDRRINAKLEQARGEQAEEKVRKLRADCEELAHVKVKVVRQLEEAVRCAVEGLAEEIESIKVETVQKSSSSKIFADARELPAATKRPKKKVKAEAGRFPATAALPLKTIYCPCGVDIGEEEIGCDSCETWYHPSCVNFPKGNLDTKAEWLCSQCRQ